MQYDTDNHSYNNNYNSNNNNNNRNKTRQTTATTTTLQLNSARNKKSSPPPSQNSYSVDIHDTDDVGIPLDPSATDDLARKTAHLNQDRPNKPANVTVKKSGMSSYWKAGNSLANSKGSTLSMSTISNMSNQTEHAFSYSMGPGAQQQVTKVHQNRNYDTSKTIFDKFKEMQKNNNDAHPAKPAFVQQGSILDVDDDADAPSLPEREKEKEKQVRVQQQQQQQKQQQPKQQQQQQQQQQKQTYEPVELDNLYINGGDPPIHNATMVVTSTDITIYYDKGTKEIKYTKERMRSIQINKGGSEIIIHGKSVISKFSISSLSLMMTKKALNNHYGSIIQNAPSTANSTTAQSVDTPVITRFSYPSQLEKSEPKSSSSNYDSLSDTYSTSKPNSSSTTKRSALAKALDASPFKPPLNLGNSITSNSIAISIGSSSSLGSSSSTKSVYRPPKEIKTVNGDDHMMHYPRSTPQELKPVGQVIITRNDLERLNEGEFLNDSLIEFYTKYINDNFLNKDYKFFFFNSFFYKKLTSKEDSKDSYREVIKWTKNDDIFEKDFIFIPINQYAHWSLMIVCFPGDESSDDPPKDRRPCMIYLDSLYKKPSPIDTRIREYLTEEWKEKKFGKDMPDGKGKYPSRTFTAKNFKAFCPHVPVQNNFSDCGVFLLHYLELFCKKPETNFVNPLEKPNWFPITDVIKKRKVLRSLIFKLRKEQFEDAMTEDEEKEYRIIIQNNFDASARASVSIDTSSLEILTSFDSSIDKDNDKEKNNKKDDKKDEDNDKMDEDKDEPPKDEDEKASSDNDGDRNGRTKSDSPVSSPKRDVSDQEDNSMNIITPKTSRIVSINKKNLSKEFEKELVMEKEEESEKEKENEKVKQKELELEMDKEDESEKESTKTKKMKKVKKYTDDDDDDNIDDKLTISKDTMMKTNKQDSINTSSNSSSSMDDSDSSIGSKSSSSSSSNIEITKVSEYRTNKNYRSTPPSSSTSSISTAKSTSASSSTSSSTTSTAKSKTSAATSTQANKNNINNDKKKKRQRGDSDDEDNDSSTDDSSDNKSSNNQQRPGKAKKVAEPLKVHKPLSRRPRKPNNLIKGGIDLGDMDLSVDDDFKK
ncbi:hypothetical protein SAMD00019534_044550 [Acytostelium subglobosum LB1]|uniref:hypothetical protein n=1 Tax=Acytostelium subglobosum LB1 TaxID=1410327 RepID=UPI00064486B2|nr:hypothetical protein SAMD00019534_044550 [Acytostelium subglobosum LB1]GAM21280.1 hypothetical protein SAMD00019534_044550 [Acytostelium subglobosum LB1]|eukprot:XP_012755399.1 hypothetical protein SAMD00019534_044550 [Acytostelium subglobosum LB1]